MRCAPPYMLRYRTRVRTCCGLVALAFGGFHRSIEKGVTCGIRNCRPQEACHWGDAADAGDLENRDWRNQADGAQRGWRP